MSLIDQIETATGLPKANYLRKGRTVIKVSRVNFSEPTAEWPKTTFRLDGEILSSTNAKHQGEVGFTGTMNLGFRYPKQDLPRMRRALCASLSAKEGRKVLESEIDSDKARELCGESQPLVGAIVTVVALEEPQRADPTKSFTHYEVEVPTESEIDALFGSTETVAAAA